MNPPPAVPDFSDWLKSVSHATEQRLSTVLDAPAASAPLRCAMRYAVLGGGKRLRPAMVFAVSETCADTDSTALTLACALEFIHCYSLIHDDLPCMDDSDERRARPSCHIAHGEAMALLAGDCLQTLAFELAAGLPDTIAPAACRHLAQGAGKDGMGGGQALDIAGGADTTEALAQMHKLKTGALFGCAIRFGILARTTVTRHAASEDNGDTVTRHAVPEKDTAALSAFAEQFGLLYQIANDITDRAQDAQANKTTYATGGAPAKDIARQTHSRAVALVRDRFPRLAQITDAVVAPLSL